MSVGAQTAGLHQIFTNAVVIGVWTNGTGTNATAIGGTTNQIIIGGVTNQYGSPASFSMTSSNQTQDVSEFDNVGYTIKFKGLASTSNGTVDVYFWKSYDNASVFESAAFCTNSWTPTGAGAYSAAGNLSVPGATTIGISFDNNTAGPATNFFISFNPKAPKVLTRYAPE